MKGGSLFLLGGAELRTGAWMARGTIVCLAPVRLLPTFSFACLYNPVVLGMYARHLGRAGFGIPHQVREGSYRRYIGDAAVPGKGELLVWQPGSS
jgi:formylmethanofuran dehydrogenase subunit C